MRALTWSLLHFLWQGAAIAALAAAVTSLFRAATTRYFIGIGALVLMLACFAVTFASLSYDGGGSGTTAGAPLAHTDALPLPAITLPATDFVSSSGNDFAWVARLWLAGVCLLALRIGFGLLLLEQLRRRNLSSLPAEILTMCQKLQQRLGIT